MIVLISGGTGLVGKKLSAKLKENGHEVRILTRNPDGRPDHYKWDPANLTMDNDAMIGTDAVVHLAGAGIADQRWTPEYKRELERSRIQSAMVLENAILRTDTKLKHFIGASASGYYGDTADKWKYENDGPGNNYLAKLCVDWEEANRDAGMTAENTSILRFGVVLDTNGGFVKRIKPIIKFGIGAVLGSGKQFIPWVHVDDIVGSIYAIITGQIESGTYNVSAPNPVTNKEMMYTMAEVLHRKILLPPVPVFALHLLFGEMKSALLQSNKISAKKLVDAGYTFEHEDLTEALKELLA